jgi:hypothetical protein
LEPHPIRYLYQGILQVGVGYYHLGRGNFHGATTKLRTGCELLDFFTPGCQGVEVAALIVAARRDRRRLLELGRERIGQFDPVSIPRVGLVGPHPAPHTGPLPSLPPPRRKVAAAEAEA